MADSHANHYNPRTSLVVHHLLTTSELIRCDIGQVTTIEVLSDRVLLAIFDFHVIKEQDFYSPSDPRDFIAGDSYMRRTALGDLGPLPTLVEGFPTVYPGPKSVQ